jgi:type II secretory pathway pseudopilin PulG
VRSVFRIVLAVVAIVAVAAVGAWALSWRKLQRAGAPSPRSNVGMLRAAALRLRADGFNGCPTARQVLELAEGSWKTELRKATNGNDPWGTPFRVVCDEDRVRVFSLGPDKLAGTEDDVSSIH